MPSNGSPRDEVPSGLPLPSPPSPLTSLIGRNVEVDLAVSLLGRDDVRLLTLTGFGGIGKTRLSMEIAARLGPCFTAGAHVVPLAGVPHAALVDSAIATSLGVPATGAKTGRDTLLTTLRDRHMLLVLDNFEHVLDASDVVADTLKMCPGIKILVTSRALLRVSGEFALPVPPLDVPDPGDGQGLDEIAASEAVRLFVDRARAVAPAFALTADNAPLVAAICRKLDGLPLAIELAATQSNVLPPAALLARIESRMPLPISGPRDAPDRHRTMRQAIAGSYDLLPEREQRIFRWCSVFVGGFGLDAAEAVCAVPSRVSSGVPGEDQADVLAGLASLVDKSMVQQEAKDGAARFSILETVREFGLQVLVERGERDAASDAHARWCLTEAERARFASITPGSTWQLARLETEHANIRAALDWWYGRGNGDDLLRLAAALGAFWYEHNHYREGRQWLERALTLTAGKQDAARGSSLVHLGILLTVQGETARAEAAIEEGLAVLRDAGELVSLSFALVLQGAVEAQVGDYARAEAVLEEALIAAAAIPDSEIVASLTARTVANLGVAAHEKGELDMAMARHELALDICREHGYDLGAIRSLRDMGDVARDQGRHTASVAFYHEGISLMGARRDVRVVLDAIEGTAMAAVAWNRPEQAARMLGAAAALGERLGYVTVVATDRAAHERTLASLRQAVGEERFQAAWSEGRRLSIDDAIGMVLAMSPPSEGEAPARDRSGVSLSPREREVLRHLVNGDPDREIAERLYLSVRTVEGHVTRLREKFGVRTRTAVVTAALAAGMIDPKIAPHDDSRDDREPGVRL